MVQIDNKRQVWLHVLILLIGGMVTYGRLVSADFQGSWDDNVYILNNEVVRGFSWKHLAAALKVGTGSIGQYNPLALLSFMADYTLWGLWPGGYHLTNIVLHVLNALMVYRLVLRLHGEGTVPLVASLLFLLHPVQVESVAWIAERKGLLSLFFMLVSWEWYCRYRDHGEGRGKGAYALSLGAYVLSLAGKTLSVVLPLVLILHDRCFSDGRRRIDFKAVLPFFIPALVFSAFEMYTESPDHGGSRVGYHGGNPLATLFTMLPVFCRYLGLLLWPAGLNIEHMPPVYRSAEGTVILAALLLLAVAAGGYFLFRADRKLGFWFLFFWLGLLPVSQIVPLFLLMYEHYLYMPIIAFGVLAGAGVDALRKKRGEAAGHAAGILAAFSIVALAAISWQRLPVWHNSLALFTDATAKSPGSFRVWEVLAAARLQAGDVEGARQAYERSLTVKPDNTDVLWGLGNLHTERGELDRGREYLERLLRVKPTYVQGWASLGNNYRDRGDYGEARRMYEKARALQPEAVQVAFLLGRLSLLEKRPAEAREQLEKVENDGWNAAETAYLLACAEAQSGRTESALAWLEKALQRGYGDYTRVGTDAALSPLWNIPEFNYLLVRFFPDKQ